MKILILTLCIVLASKTSTADISSSLNSAFNSVVKSNLDISVKVDDPNGSNKKIDKDLVSYIEEGTKQIQESKIKQIIYEKGLMIIGLTGTGKSTFINYLNDVPLFGNKTKGCWVLDVKESDYCLPGDFKIGHKTKSETRFPSFYSPKNNDFTFIDTPGFSDTNFKNRLNF